MPIKEAFPLHKDVCYLNHAAVAPWPKATALAVQDFADQNMQFGAKNYLNWLKTEQRLRLNLQTLINAESVDEIALAKNTSEALSMIAYGIDWQAGDIVVISDQEFPSNRIVWESLKNQGVKLVEVNIDNPMSATDNLINALHADVKLFSISAVQYASGIRLDLERLGAHCKQHNILYCIDAIQWIGALPFDVQRYQADFVVADGHKWMLGPEGLALFYVAKPNIPKLALNQFGWHMVKQRGDYDTKSWEPAENATRFECGSPNMLGVTALNASIELLLEYGLEKVSQDLENIVSYLIEKLQQIDGLTIISPIPTNLRAGIVTFMIENCDHNQLYRKLMDKNVICACRGGGIRFSPHFYTTKTVIDNAMDILQDIVR